MTSKPSATLAHRASRSDHVLSQDVGGEAVLLDLAGEHYFGLNKVGTRIWQLLESTTALSEVHCQLCADFDADEAHIERDLLGLIDELHVAGLVTLR